MEHLCIQSTFEHLLPHPEPWAGLLCLPDEKTGMWRLREEELVLWGANSVPAFVLNTSDVDLPNILVKDGLC